MESIVSELSPFTERVSFDRRRCVRFCEIGKQSVKRRVISRDGCIEEFYIEQAGISHRDSSAKFRFSRGKF
jgi:hypothetical protein